MPLSQKPQCSVDFASPPAPIAARPRPACLAPAEAPAAQAGPSLLGRLKDRLKANLRAHPVLFRKALYFRESYRDWRHPTPERAARAAYFRRFFAREGLAQREQRRYLEDFFRCQECFGADEFDYLLYDFRHLTDPEKAAFITQWRRLAYYRRLNRTENRWIFKNKDETHRHFQRFFRREFLHLRGSADWPAFNAFCDRHDSFIGKPRDSSCGKGVRLYPSVRHNRREQFHEILRHYSGEVVLEELIRQGPELAAFHPSSVNTVRITTVCLGTETVVFHPFFRSGVGGSVVDNGGAGGILAAIHPRTGRIETDGRDENGVYYRRHPNSGLSFKGFQIPRWPEVVALAEEVARVVPTNRYTGWDFALTAHGWVLVEGNDRGQFIGFQMLTGRGVAEEFEQLLARHGV